MTNVVPSWAQQIVQSYTGDEFIQGILEKKLLQSTELPDWKKIGDLLRYKGRLVVESYTNLRQDLQQEMHNSAIGGHSGIQGTYLRLKKLFCWSGMKSEVINGLNLVMIVLEVRPTQAYIQAYCNLYRFPTRLGHIFQWISLKGYLSHRGKPPSW